MEELAPYKPQTKEDIAKLIAEGKERDNPDPDTYEPNIEKAATMANRETEPRQFAALEREVGRIARAASAENYEHTRDPNDTSVTGEYIKSQTTREAFDTNAYRAGLTADAVRSITQRTENTADGKKPDLKQVAEQAEKQAEYIDQNASRVGKGTAQAYDELYGDKK